jgi:hypothetical protein
VFRNCSAIGTGGGISSSTNARLNLIRPRFIDCLAGYIGWSHTHKPGYGDGCYCEGADPKLCTGCTCKKGTAGGVPGFYCDSETSNSTSTCSTVLEGLCGNARSSSVGDCFICCGSHQQALHAAGCDPQDFASFCG